MSAIDIDPAEHITVGAVGAPGGRTFYVQGRGGGRLVTLLVEKQQVGTLSGMIDELLQRVGTERGRTTDASGEAPDLEEPLVPEFRVGQIGVGYEAERDLVLLQCEELAAAEEDDTAREPSVVRFWTTREQIAALAKRGHASVASGRPSCSMCGEPIDADGHFCPPSNGHKQTDELP